MCHRCVILSPMSIKETLEKIKPFYNLLLILTISSIFFALGRLSTEKTAQYSDNSINIGNIKDKEVAQVIKSLKNEDSKNLQNSTSTQSIDTEPKAEVIGSKSGKKYYFPWCGTVKRIKPENQIKFDSIEDAKLAGFTPGGN